MSTIETATGCRITVGPKGLALWDRSAHLIGYELSTPLTDDERRDLADALVPGRDFSGVDWKGMYDQARRERDAAVARAEQLERELSKVEGRASEWSIKAQQWRERAEAAEARTAPAVTREEVSQVVHGVLSTWYDNEDVVDAVCDLFGVGAGQAVDPVEAKARELYEHVYVGRFEDGSSGVQTEYRKLAAYLLWQEDPHVDR